MPIPSSGLSANITEHRTAKNTPPRMRGEQKKRSLCSLTLSRPMPFAALRAAGLSPRLLSSPAHGIIYQLDKLIDRTTADELFDGLTGVDGPAFQTQVDAFGPQQRQSAYWGDDRCEFSYVGLRLRPSRWPELLPLVEARRRASIVAKAHGTAFTACLANHYPRHDGLIPWHHDEVRAHGEAKLVLALSLGGTRRMLLRRRDAGVPPLALTLPAGSAVVMGGTAQQFWEHSLPLDLDSAERRISLTFRSIVPGFEEGRSPPMVNS